ncbi:GtrA family protein [Candidatus Saccharibacteria bacterium]|nr:GtrA family protein [Candidatus Saccharibacteria bacterium]
MVDAKHQSSPSNQRRLARVGKFGAVGIINTIIDFGIYNVLAGVFGFHILVANAISTTVAMVFSFFANRNVVFESKDGSKSRQALLFVLVTAFGLYILQLGTLHLLTTVWLGPVNLATSIVHSLGLSSTFSDTFVRNNAAKVAATVISLIWNYIMYKRVVFK